jgi:hypothetical protein
LFALFSLPAPLVVPLLLKLLQRNNSFFERYREDAARAQAPAGILSIFNIGNLTQ